MKLVNCSKCFNIFPPKQTVVVDKKRVCGKCRSKPKEQEFKIS